MRADDVRHSLPHRLARGAMLDLLPHPGDVDNIRAGNSLLRDTFQIRMPPESPDRRTKRMDAHSGGFQLCHAFLIGFPVPRSQHRDIQPGFLLSDRQPGNRATHPAGGGFDLSDDMKNAHGVHRD